MGRIRVHHHSVLAVLVQPTWLGTTPMYQEEEVAAWVPQFLPPAKLHEGQ